MERFQQVRGGGKATPEGFLFELTGGNLALDLANTVDNRPTDRRRELLRAYQDLVAWGEQSGCLGPAAASQLRQAAQRHPSAARRVLREATQLREAIFSIFSSVIAGCEPPPKNLAKLNAAIPTALARLRLALAERGFSWRWDEREIRLDRVVWPAIRAAGELLTSGDLSRVRMCASDECDWLFLDTSRNRSRRWCDMSVCGNRSKVRSFHRRRKRREADGSQDPLQRASAPRPSREGTI